MGWLTDCLPRSTRQQHRNLPPQGSQSRQGAGDGRFPAHAENQDSLWRVRWPWLCRPCGKRGRMGVDHTRTAEARTLQLHFLSGWTENQRPEQRLYDPRRAERDQRLHHRRRTGRPLQGERRAPRQRGQGVVQQPHGRHETPHDGLYACRLRGEWQALPRLLPAARHGW